LAIGVQTGRCAHGIALRGSTTHVWHYELPSPKQSKSPAAVDAEGERVSTPLSMVGQFLGMRRPRPTLMSSANADL